MESWMFIFFCLFLSGMDIWYTYYNLKILKKHRKHWKNSECNIFVQYSWNTFGFFRGTMVAAIATFIGIFAMGWIIGENEFLQGFVIGIFVIIHHIHYLNYAYISRKYLKKEPPLLGRFISEW